MLLLKTSRQSSDDSRLQWLKHFESLLNRKDLGFFDIAYLQKLHLKTRERVGEIAVHSDVLAVVGIGGSSLGGRVIVETFGSSSKSKEVVFFDNVDPIEFESLIEKCGPLNRVHWLFISKSGTTIETLAVLDQVNVLYKEQALNLGNHATVVTELRENALHFWAQKNGVLSLEIPINVGGRFSVLTPVGLFPAEFLGVSGESILSGAKEIINNPTVVCSMADEVMRSFQREEWITVFWFYSSLQRYFGLWLEQLWAESLAKKSNRKMQPALRVSSPMSCVGSTDQHSVLQQFMEGARDKFIIFIRDYATERSGRMLKETSFDVQKILLGKSLGALLAAEAEATQMALERVGVSTARIETQRLSPEGLGELFMFFQLLIGTLGEALDINAFDQPGVELGKRLARDLLKN